MRTKLVRIIKNWETSGQGEGSKQGHHEDNEVIENRDPEELSAVQLGRLENRSAFAMHSRKNFIDHPSQGRVGTWILYYWEQMDRFQLLECTINVLSNEVSASDAQSAPFLDILSPTRKKRNRSSFASVGTMSDVDEDSAIRQVGDGLLKYVEASKRISHHSTLTSRRRELEAQIYELSKSIRENKMARIRCKQANEKALLDNFINEDEIELDNKQKELAEVVTKLNALDAEN